MKMSKRDFRTEVRKALLESVCNSEGLINDIDYLALPDDFEEAFEKEHGEEVDFEEWKMETALDMIQEIVDVLNQHFSAEAKQGC
jgi:hypothetical protein